MIQNPHLLKQFEQDAIRKHQPDYHANLKIVEALFQEATTLGIFPLQDLLQDIDIDIHYAKVINVRTPFSEAR